MHVVQQATSLCKWLREKKGSLEMSYVGTCVVIIMLAGWQTE